MSSITLGSINILEPYILLSDIVTAACCFCCFFNIKSKTEHFLDGKMSSYWRKFFLFEGISFFIGGFAHGLYYYFGNVLHFLGWYASIAGMFYFVWGLIKASDGLFSPAIIYVLLFALATSAVLSTALGVFEIIVGYSFLLMFVVIFVNAKSKLISFKKSESKGILLGTLLFIISAAVHVFEINIFGIAKQITSHIIIAAGILVFGKGCLETIISSGQKDNNVKQESIIT